MAVCGTAIGIDLFGSDITLGVWHNDSFHLIPDQHGNLNIPSCICSTRYATLVGHQAEALARSTGPTSGYGVMYHVQRFLGKTLADVCADARPWPLIVLPEPETSMHSTWKAPTVEAWVLGERHKLRVEQLCAELLTQLVEMADSFIGNKIDSVVLSVPHSFGDAQREALRATAQIAGIKLLRLLPVHSAVGVAYWLKHQPKHECTVMVVNMGSSSFEAAVLTVEDGIVEVHAAAGNDCIGSIDCDRLLLDYCLKEYRHLEPGWNPTAATEHQLRQACTIATRALAAGQQATVDVDELRIEIEPEQFDHMCSDVYRECMECVCRAFEDAALPSERIQSVLMSGLGVMQQLQTKLSEMFVTARICSLSNDAIVLGAAALAHLMQGEQQQQQLADIILLDVAPASIGLETAGGLMHTLIRRNSTIPAKMTQTFTTYADHSCGILLQVFAGEADRTRDNSLMGKFQVQNMPPAPRGVPQIEITFDVDVDGVLRVTGLDRRPGSNVWILADKGAWGNAEEIKQMACDAAAVRDREASNRRWFYLREILIGTRDAGSLLNSLCGNTHILQYICKLAM